MGSHFKGKLYPGYSMFFSKTRKMRAIFFLYIRHQLPIIILQFGCKNYVITQKTIIKILVTASGFLRADFDSLAMW